MVNNLNCFPLWYSFPFFEYLVEVPFTTELQHQIDVVFGQNAVVDSNYERTGLLVHLL